MRIPKILLIPGVACVLLVGAAGAQAGEPVIAFLGTDSYGLVGTPAALQIPSSNPFTIESWIWIQTLTTRNMIYSKNNARSTPYTFMVGFIDTGKMAAYTGGAWMQPTPAVTVTTGRWYHAAYAFDGTNMVYYLDGVSVGTSTFSFVNTSAHTIKIGGYAGSTDLRGLQSELRVWNYARSAEEIARDMNGRASGIEPGLIGCWPLDEGTGTTVYDSTTNASHASLVGGVWTNVDDLSFAPTVTLKNPLTGSTDYTCTNEVELVFGGQSLEPYDLYQITESAVEPEAGWLALEPTNPPATATFAVPDPEGEVTLYVWLKETAETVPVTNVSDSIVYIRTGATVTATAADITRTLFGTNNAVIDRRSLDLGSTASPLDLYRISLSCAGDLTPERDDIVTVLNTGSSQDVSVVLSVMDEAGNTAVAASTVSLLVVTEGYGAYVWAGAGVTNGTADTDWLWSDNWRVDGVIPGSPPGWADDATVTLSTNHTEVVAVVVGAGATARYVTFSGMNDATRHVRFSGDATFSTLNYGTARNSLSILAGCTLTLTGGEINTNTLAVVRRTFISPSALGDMYYGLSFQGTIRFTGPQVVIRFTGGVDGRMEIADPDAWVHFDGYVIGMGGDLYVYDTQRMLGLNATVGMRPLRYSKDLYSQDGQPLTNFAACNVGNITYTMSSGAPFTLPAGTYKSIAAGYNGHYSGNALYEISGDTTCAGANPAGYSVYVQRRRYSGGALAAGADLGLNSNRLTVTGGAPIQIGDFDGAVTTNAHPLWWNQIRAQGSIVTTDGDIRLGPGGYFVGDSNTVITVGGNWDNRAQWFTNSFKLEQATLVPNGGTAPDAPTTLEAQSADMGPGPTGMTNNHAVGRLEIGETGTPAFVRLVDGDDFRADDEADVLYVGSLYVAAGSILDVAGLTVYVDGEPIGRRWTEFGPGLIIDSTRPAGTLLLIR